MGKEIIVGDNKEIMKNSDGTPLIFEVDPGYEVGLIELPGEYDVESFFKNTEEIDAEEELISKPYPSEHSCPHSSLKFETMRSGSRTHDGKRYRVLYGKVSGSNKWIVASFRYPKSAWDAAAAKAHCKAHGGLAFEGAVTKTDEKTQENMGDQLIDVKKADEMRHLVYGIYLQPNIVDLQKDIEDELEIEKAAHRYMLRLWKDEKPEMVGSEHAMPIADALVVESYIAPTSFWFDGTPHDEAHKVHKGSWVVCALIADDIEFQKILDGDYTGFSIQGHGRRRAL